MSIAQRDIDDTRRQSVPGKHEAGKERQVLFTSFREIGPFLTLGIQLAGAVALMFFLGRWLDQRWGTAPWMMLLGTAFGLGAGLFSFVRTAIAIGRKPKEKAGGRDG